MYTRARSFALSFLSFQSGLTLCFADLCQILEMFSLNSIGCVTKGGPAGILEEIQPTDVCKVNRAQIFIQKDGSNILTAR